MTPKMTQNLSAQAQRFWISMKIRLYWASVVCGCVNRKPKLAILVAPRLLKVMWLLRSSTAILTHGLRTPREEIAFTAWPKIHSQIFRYGQSIFCLPHRPNFSNIFGLCLHWVSVVRGYAYFCPAYCTKSNGLDYVTGLSSIVLVRPNMDKSHNVIYTIYCYI